MAFQRKLVPDSYISPDHRPEGSINALLHELPVQREYARQAYGLLLLLPRTGITGYIVEPRTGGAHFRVLYPNPELHAYPQGCDIWVGDQELLRAVEMKAVPAAMVETVQFGLKYFVSGGDGREDESVMAWFDTEDEARYMLQMHDERFEPGRIWRRVTFLPPADRWMVTG